MSLTPEEEEELALLEAEEADAAKRKNTAKQNAAFASVEAEDILAGPTTKEKLAAGGLAFADAVAPPPIPNMNPFENPLGVASTVLTAPATLPMATTMSALRALAGTDKAIEGAKEDAPGAFGVGGGLGALLNLALGGKTAAKVAPGVKAAATPAVGRARNVASASTPTSKAKFVESIPVVGKPAATFMRTKAALDDAGPSGDYAAMLREQMAEPMPSAPTKSALVKILEAVDDAPPAPATPARAPAGAPDMPADVMAGGVPKDVRAAAVQRISADDVGSAIEKGGDVPSFPGRPQPKGVTLEPLPNFLTAEETAAAARMSRPSPPAAAPKPAPVKMSDAQIEQFAREAARQGKSNNAIQAELKRMLGRDVNLTEFAAKADNERLFGKR